NIKRFRAGEAHVASAKHQDPIVKAEQLENALGVLQHLLMLLIAFIRVNDLDQLDFIKLMDADEPTSADSGCAGLAAKARRVRAVMDRQTALFQNLFPMN